MLAFRNGLPLSLPLWDVPLRSSCFLYLVLDDLSLIWTSSFPPSTFARSLTFSSLPFATSPLLHSTFLRSSSLNPSKPWYLRCAFLGHEFPVQVWQQCHRFSPWVLLFFLAVNWFRHLCSIFLPRIWLNFVLFYLHIRSPFNAFLLLKLWGYWCFQSYCTHRVRQLACWSNRPC